MNMIMFLCCRRSTGFVTSFSLPSPTGDRLKPPPNCIDFKKKTIKLNSSSSSSSSSTTSSTSSSSPNTDRVSTSLNRLKLNTSKNSTSENLSGTVKKIKLVNNAAKSPDKSEIKKSEEKAANSCSTEGQNAMEVTESVVGP